MIQIEPELRERELLLVWHSPYVALFESLGPQDYELVEGELLVLVDGGVEVEELDVSFS